MTGAHPRLTIHQRIGPGWVLGRGSASPYRALTLVDGEEHLVRHGLGGDDGWPGPSSRRRPLLSFVHVTDLQLADVQSPAKFEFVNREFEDPRYAELVPTQRPQEALTPHAVDAMVRVVN